MFHGDYLRVLTPVTSDGTTLVYSANGQPVYREDHVPITAQKKLEEKNLKLPVHLRKKIEYVPSFIPAPVNKKVKA